MFIFFTKYLKLMKDFSRGIRENSGSDKIFMKISLRLMLGFCNHSKPQVSTCMSGYSGAINFFFSCLRLESLTSCSCSPLVLLAHHYYFSA